MAIDFDALLVAPGQNTFAKPITVIPTVSQPGTPDIPAHGHDPVIPDVPAVPPVPYTGRGVWSSNITEVLLEDGARLTTRTLSISIRLSEYAIPPVQGDEISLVSDTESFFAGIALGTTVSFNIDDLQFKGDGSCLIILKRVCEL